MIITDNNETSNVVDVGEVGLMMLQDNDADSQEGE